MASFLLLALPAALPGAGPHDGGEPEVGTNVDAEQSEALSLMWPVKQALDPHGIMNPGTLLGSLPGQP